MKRYDVWTEDDQFRGEITATDAPSDKGWLVLATDAEAAVKQERERCAAMEVEHKRLATACEAYLDRVDPDFAGDMPSWFDRALPDNPLTTGGEE